MRLIIACECGENNNELGRVESITPTGKRIEVGICVECETDSIYSDE